MSQLTELEIPSRFLASSEFVGMTLIHDKIQAIQDIEHNLYRGIEQLAIVSRLEADQSIPESVIQYLEEVSPANEGLFTVSLGAGKTIATIIEGLKKMIEWMYTTAIDLFKMIFDQYYRSQRKFLKFQQYLMSITEEGRKERIKGYKTTITSYGEAVDLLQQIIAMNKEIQSASGVSISEHLDRFVVTATEEFGCKLIDGKLVDVSGFTKSSKLTTLKDQGWTYDTIARIVEGMLLAASENTSSKQAEKNVISAVKSLEREVNALVRANTDPVIVTRVQQRVADRKKVQDFITSSLRVTTVRFTWLDNQVSAAMTGVLKTR